MSAFSNDLLNKIVVPPEYFSEASLHQYVGKESHLCLPLFENNFDCHSDVSVDTSFSLNSSEYLNWAMHMQHKIGVEDLYCDTSLARNDAASIGTPLNPNIRSNDSVKWSQEPVLKEEIRNIKKEKSSDIVASKKKKKVKPLKSTDNDEKKVFLGGLPIGITERMVRESLSALGYKVLKRPKILHGFAPEVLMKTVDQAKDLIEKGKIMIEGLEVEVRPYNSWTQLSELKKLPNVGKRSVFIRGLSNSTTTKNLQDVLLEMGMKVINYPVIKNGFARQVILDTISQAKGLINLKKIQVNGTFVDVRPFDNYRRKRRNK